MVHLDLFSGIGGFALAASWVWGEDHHIHSFVEIEPFCQKVLKKHWPDIPIHSDIRTYKHDGTAIDLLTGGFPCQPFSQAGKRRGKDDDRFLWPAMLQVIQAAKPSWVIGENVAGLINMELEQALSDLEANGYEVEAVNIPACAVGANHERQRIWIVANANQRLWSGSGVSDFVPMEKLGSGWQTTTDLPLIGSKWLELNTDRRSLRNEDGFSEAVDRIESLGNAIVPQVVVPIFQVIKTIMEKP